MSEPTETSGLPSAFPTQQEQHPKGNTTHTSSASSTRNKHRMSKYTSTRRRTGAKVQSLSDPNVGPSRHEQPPTSSLRKMPTNMSSVHLTRTGRISKAKKGLKVHDCECGRSYTRAEHLRRHQKNHAKEDALMCEFPECGKIFYRPDLLLRHQERHNEPDENSRHSSVFSPEGSIMSHQDRESLPSHHVMAYSLSSGYTGLQSLSHMHESIYQTAKPTNDKPREQQKNGSIQHWSPNQPVSPLNEAVAHPRYNLNPFRTPQAPRVHRSQSSGFLHVSHPSPTSSPNPKQQRFVNRSSITSSVPIDSMSGSLNYTEPYSQSPEYSISSGYASPVPGPYDFNSNMYPIPSYNHVPVRTRTSSNASTEPWYTPRSPPSSTTTMQYNWVANDKVTTAPGLAYVNTSYPMPSLGMTTSCEQMPYAYSSKTMMSRDEDEGIILFPEQPYGMGQIAHTYSLDQYLNNYWRFFHPTFPVVHRFTFVNTIPSPMLHAAMIAIGGQYSSDMSVRRKSRILHDRCIKLLGQREHEPMAEQERVCDYQAIFLIEMLSQYRARRAAKTLSPRFGTLYHKAAENFSNTTEQLTNIAHSLSRIENVSITSWVRWIELSTWQRLLVACYILETQQAMTLAREASSSLLQCSGVDLPFPSPTVTWDAITLNDWAMAVQQEPQTPQYIYGVEQGIVIPCDTFQSSVLIAAHYNRLDSSEPYVSVPSTTDIDYRVEASFITTQRLLTAKLVQLTPIRALLAVSGESWIFSEKVSSPELFSHLRTTLRTWIAPLWSNSNSESEFVPVKEALRLAIQILQLALNEQPDAQNLGMGADIGLYFATLVLWAITAAAGAKSNTQQQSLQVSPSQHPPLSTIISQYNAVSVLSSSPQPNGMFSSNTSHTSTPAQVQSFTQLPTQATTSGRHDSHTTTNLLSHDQIILESTTFLSTILNLLLATTEPHSTVDVDSLQSGCNSLLLWVKVQLRNTSLENQNGLALWASRPSEGLGELLDSIIGSLERILNRGWTGWGF